MGLGDGSPVKLMFGALEFRVYLRLLGLFGAFWGKVWALGAKVWDPNTRVGIGTL